MSKFSKALEAVQELVAGLNIDPQLAMQALQASNMRELNEALAEIEREQDIGRTAELYINARANNQY